MDSALAFAVCYFLAYWGVLLFLWWRRCKHLLRP